ncbi:hypothetical protein EEL31_10365 [Brevibacillus laterosporus]|nr:phage tail domain-containing protein [Brevibacillus laterosporus]TPG68892.1 hypothetical protein EEL31_10365 [Brevibacillus laterosporus]
MKWNDLRLIRGSRTSPVFSIGKETGSGYSKINWIETVPTGAKTYIESNVSYDGGLNWKGWKRVVNSNSLPDFTVDTNHKSTVFQYRYVATANTKDALPTLHDFSIVITPTFVFINNGDVPCKPEIWIEKIGDGDLSIINKSNKNLEFSFKGIKDKEKLYIDCEREYIETDIYNVYRYDNFNNQYLEIVRGRNILEFKGSFKARFRYEFKTIQG